MKIGTWVLAGGLLVACDWNPGAGSILPNESGGTSGIVSLAPGGSAAASFTAKWYADRGTLSVFALLLGSVPPSPYLRTFTLTFPNGEIFTESNDGGGNIGTEKNVRCNKDYGCAMEAIGTITFQDLRPPVESIGTSEVSWILNFAVSPSVHGMKVSNLEITVADQDAGTN